VEDTLAVLAGCLGEIVVGRSAAEFLRKSSVKDSRAVDEGGGVGAACSVRAGSAALGFFHLLQGCGRSPWVLFVFGGEAERCLSVRAVAVCSGEAAMLEECEVVVWCVGGKLGEVGDQELRGVCFGGGGVLLRRFPGRLLPKPAEPGSARSGHSRGLANHRAPEYSYHLPATSLHLLSFSFPKKPYLPPEVRSTAHQPSSNFATISFCSAAFDSAKKSIYRRCPRFSRKELQIGVARYASTKPHACMHADCTVQVR
jgi:hypothetical protein